ncbi:hypothetical protein, partial [Staphylococcus epidermidis]
MSTLPFHTLPSKLNHYETEAICQLFKHPNYQTLQFQTNPDV